MSQTISFSTDDYCIPSWSASPSSSFHFQIIKEGNFLNTQQIKSKSFSLIGRLEDLCDIFIDNPTVSRKHAILQFKQGEPLPYLYDLGGTHGTIVNRNKLPPKVYTKLQPFDTIKFGISSRLFVLRCPELQKEEEQEELKNENKFMDILAQKKKVLSKQEMKQKYLDLLENDPYYKANSQSKKFMGKEKGNIDGVDWGIGDEYQIYAYKNENQYMIEPDILRRLPGLDQNQHNKISQYETNLRKYEEIEGQLNELGNKERRQFGLEEKQREKKEKLQKRFVEAVETLQKSQDWIRKNIFGEESITKKAMNKIRQTDSFEGDEFLDRTINNKSKPIVINKEENEGIMTTIDYWKLDKDFKQKLQELKILKQSNKNEKNQTIEQNEEEDELQQYMKKVNENLDEENELLHQNQLEKLLKQISYIRDQLLSVRNEKELKKIEDIILNNAQSEEVSEEKEKEKKRKENHKKISNILEQLEKIRQEEDELEEDDIKIFDLYKQQEKQLKKLKEEETGKRKKVVEKEDEHFFEKPVAKYPKEKIIRDMKSSSNEQEYEDLTKFK